MGCESTMATRMPLLDEAFMDPHDVCLSPRRSYRRVVASSPQPCTGETWSDQFLCNRSSCRQKTSRLRLVRQEDQYRSNHEIRTSGHILAHHQWPSQGSPH